MEVSIFTHSTHSPHSKKVYFDVRTFLKYFIKKQPKIRKDAEKKQKT